MVHFKISLFFVILLIASPKKENAQTPFNIDLNRDVSISLENALHNNNALHSSIKPFLNSELLKNDTLLIDRYIPSIPKITSTKKTFIEIKSLLFSQPGFDLNKKKTTLELYTGASINLSLSTKTSVNFNTLFGNSNFVNYTTSFIKQAGIIPGNGIAYSSKLGYSYQNYSGYLSYSPSKIFNFQIGKDKHFFGDGYRSLFLSDVSQNYPFAKISTTVWKIKYVNLFTAFKDITAPSHLSADFKNKFGTFHYLSWNATKRINLNFFESIIWQGNDTNRSRGYDFNYLNPVIFYRPVEYSLGSSDNALLGFGFKIKAFKKQQFYGQLILDEFLLKQVLARNGWWANKQGFQLGFKSLDFFKVPHLVFQTELNYVRPYTYSHGSVQQNYGHFNQPLAHPLGANFVESVTFLTYHKNKWTYEFKGIAAVYGSDTAGFDSGKDIFKSYALHPKEYGNKTTQGLKTTLLIGDLRIAYLLIPTWHLKLEAGFSERIEKSSKQTLSNPFIYIGIRTLLGNFYTDY